MNSNVLLMLNYVKVIKKCSVNDRGLLEHDYHALYRCSRLFNDRHYFKYVSSLAVLCTFKSTYITRATLLSFVQQISSFSALVGLCLMWVLPCINRCPYVNLISQRSCLG
jgi:hypothetical protein